MVLLGVFTFRVLLLRLEAEAWCRSFLPGHDRA